MSALDQVVGVFGLEHENPVFEQTALFLYTAAVVQGVRGKNIVHKVALTLSRAFGSDGFLLPLVLGGLPSATYKAFDAYLTTIIAAIFFVTVVLDRFVPSNVSDLLAYPTDLAYAVVKGNAAGHGFVMVAAALPDSLAAPLFGAYLAVNGHRMLENGIGALAVSKFDGDNLLGVVGGALYYALIEYGRVSAIQARVLLVVFRVSADYVDYNGLYNQVYAAITDVIPSGKSSKRGRSRTPKRK